MGFRGERSFTESSGNGRYRPNIGSGETKISVDPNRGDKLGQSEKLKAGVLRGPDNSPLARGRTEKISMDVPVPFITIKAQTNGEGKHRIQETQLS